MGTKKIGLNGEKVIFLKDEVNEKREILEKKEILKEGEIEEREIENWKSNLVEKLKTRSEIL